MIKFNETMYFFHRNKITKIEDHLKCGVIPEACLYTNDEFWSNVIETEGFKETISTTESAFEKIMSDEKTVEKIGYGRNCISLIDLGVGTPPKNKIMLQALAKSSAVSKIHFFPVDISKNLLNECVSNLKKWQSDAVCDIEVSPICGDFLEIDEWGRYLHDDKKIVCLLGATIGNFSERELLTKIKKIMSRDDLLLIDLEYAEDKEKLMKKYSADEIIDFVMAPIEQLIEKVRMNFVKTKVSVELLDDIDGGVDIRRDATNWVKKKITDVKNSSAITFKIDLNEVISSGISLEDKFSEILLSWSTKYDRSSIKQFFKDVGFNIQNSVESGGGEMFLLRKASSPFA